jgi:hypothetical protein
MIIYRVISNLFLLSVRGVYREAFTGVHVTFLVSWTLHKSLKYLSNLTFLVSWTLHKPPKYLSNLTFLVSWTLHQSPKVVCEGSNSLER